MAQKSRTLEQSTIAECIDKQKMTTLFLRNGFQLHCRILDQDDTVVIIDEDAGNGRWHKRMVYKDAISTLNL